MNDFFVGTILSSVGFLFVGAVLWLLIIISVIVLLWGVLKKSWKGFFFSGLFVLIPAIILSTQKGFFILFLFLPLLVFVIAYLMKTRT
ncbi:hypothetical protein [Peribacillus asahii]|uniref:hypothetical protein n=1 Tax=Peribacillus asahii TaxID=228899 RepID=UPI00207A9E02|nr:hypothetical protein [Peribacillus asahii]USK58191.1 hypothetical protein LIT37_13005 [Peribacillus asahii]